MYGPVDYSCPSRQPETWLWSHPAWKRIPVQLCSPPEITTLTWSFKRGLLSNNSSQLLTIIFLPDTYESSPLPQAAHSPRDNDYKFIQWKDTAFDLSAARLVDESPDIRDGREDYTLCRGDSQVRRYSSRDLKWLQAWQLFYQVSH